MFSDKRKIICIFVKIFHPYFHFSEFLKFFNCHFTGKGNMSIGNYEKVLFFSLKWMLVMFDIQIVSFPYQIGFVYIFCTEWANRIFSLCLRIILTSWIEFWRCWKIIFFFIYFDRFNELCGIFFVTIYGEVEIFQEIFVCILFINCLNSRACFDFIKNFHKV